MPAKQSAPRPPQAPSDFFRPCIRCLFQRVRRVRAGLGRSLCIIQCGECGFNVTALTFEQAERMWNEWAVWTLVPKPPKATVGADR